MSTSRPFDIRFVSILLVALVAIVASAATAQPSYNGLVADLEEQPQVPRKHQSEVAITAPGAWHMFSFTAANVQAVGCQPADPAGLPCGLGPGQVPVGPPPWVIEAPAAGTTLTVVDAFILGLVRVHADAAIYVFVLLGNRSHRVKS